MSDIEMCEKMRKKLPFGNKTFNIAKCFQSFCMLTLRINISKVVSYK